METITVCLSEPQLFSLAFDAAVEFVYFFKAYAGLVDPNGLHIEFQWVEESQCYWTDQMPAPGEPA